jgi:hypothetical protein
MILAQDRLRRHFGLWPRRRPARAAPDTSRPLILAMVMTALQAIFGIAQGLLASSTGTQQKNACAFENSKYVAE